MKQARQIGAGGGFIHGLTYALLGDSAWLTTLLTLVLLGVVGGVLLSRWFDEARGISLLLVAFLIGLLPNSLYLNLIGSDNNAFFFGTQAGACTVIYSLFFACIQ